MLLKRFPLFLFLFVTLQSLAQPKGHYFPFSMGYGFETVKDEALSPVSYSGSLGAVGLGYHYQNDKWISMLDINGLAGYQYPDLNRDEGYRNTLTGLVRAHYQLSRKVWQLPSSIDLFAGLVSHNSWDYRDHSRYGNSSANYIGLFSLGPIITAQKPFTLFSRNFTLAYRFGFPVATYYLRPTYIKPFLNQEIGSKGFAFWGDFYSLNSRTDLIYQLGNGNELRLSYVWDYYQLDLLNKVQLANHILSISTVFRF